MMQNYGAGFDLVEVGVTGPVEIVGKKGDDIMVKDLSHHKWTYKVGLDGMSNQFFSANTKAALQWNTENLPIQRRMTWYKVLPPFFSV